MRKNFILPLLVLIFFSFGCRFIDKFKNSANANSNANVATPLPSLTADSTAATPTASPTDEVKDDAFRDQKDLLAFASGTIFAKKPQELYEGSSNWGSLGLIDELPNLGWAMKGTAVNEMMVLEMQEQTQFKTLVFDTAKTDTDGSSAKDIIVEISDVSTTDGFQEVLSTTLKDKTDNQVFDLAKQIPGRWLRLTVKNNYGSKDYTEIMEFRGYGDQLSSSPVQNISGTYKMKQYGDFHLKQDGTSVSGCYEYNSGLFDGGFEDRVMRLTWREGGSDNRHGGPAVMVFSRDGKKITGAYAREGGGGFLGEWSGEKISDKVGNCPHAPNLDKTNAAKDIIGKELKEKGRAAVYGINFDFNSDVIREESKPTLAQIVALLKENADWKMMIEGHTDSIGGQTFNQSLSEKRAAAVVKYLTDAGIDASRLSSAGFGLSNPIADNNSEFGRAQNRRVELVKH